MMNWTIEADKDGLFRNRIRRSEVTNQVNDTRKAACENLMHSGSVASDILKRAELRQLPCGSHRSNLCNSTELYSSKESSKCRIIHSKNEVAFPAVQANVLSIQVAEIFTSIAGLGKVG